MSHELTQAEQYISWMKTKADLNSLSTKASRRFVKRGQVYWCHFGINIGSEISKATPRPAVIVSNFAANKNSSNVIVVPITHNSHSLPCMVPIEPLRNSDGVIILDGQIDTADIICVSKARLGDHIATLSTAQMRTIDKAIAVSLELLGYYDKVQTKYKKLNEYVERVKDERNAAQDMLKDIKLLIDSENPCEETQKKIKEILDIK